MFSATDSYLDVQKVSSCYVTPMPTSPQ